VPKASPNGEFIRVLAGPDVAKYYRKNSLGILRLVNYFVALVVGYAWLTRFWGIVNRVAGWFFVPLGQATLYAFIVHIYIIALLSNLPWFWQDNIWVNTAGHTMALLGIWWMIRHKLLFRWIPR